MGWNVMKPIIVVAIAALLIAGCASREEREQRESAEDHQKCVSFGVKPQTEAYANCRVQMMQVRAQEKAARAAKRRAIMQNYNNTTRGMNSGTTCTQVGSTTYCN